MRLLTSAAAIAAALILPVAAHAADAPVQVTLDASKPGAVIDRNIFGQFAERYEEIQAALLAASGLILASAASAQTAGTPILAGLRIGRFPVRDRTSPSMIPSRGRQSGRAQTTGTGGIWEVVAIHAVDGGVAKGDHVVASVWVKSNVPAKAVFRIEAGAGPRARVDDRFIDIGPISVLNKDGN